MGCHTDNDGTNYHCHEDKRRVEKKEAPKTSESKEVAAEVKREQEQKQAQMSESVEQWQLDGLRREMLRRTSSNNTPSSSIGFNDSSALGALGISMALVTAGAVVGSMLAADSVDNSFAVIGAPAIGAGLMSSSVLAIQVGLDSDTLFAGGILVVVSAFAPLILGGAF
jgi:hypothetical protein